MKPCDGHPQEQRPGDQILWDWGLREGEDVRPEVTEWESMGLEATGVEAMGAEATVPLPYVSYSAV